MRAHWVTEGPPTDRFAGRPGRRWPPPSAHPDRNRVIYQIYRGGNRLRTTGLITTVLRVVVTRSVRRETYSAIGTHSFREKVVGRVRPG